MGDTLHTRPIVTSRILAAALPALLLTSACARSEPARAGESASAPASSEVSRQQAIELARQFIARDSAVSRHVYLDSIDVAEGEAIWHVMFRRRALVVPAVVTVDVDRRTGAMRFPGDE